jgi:uncharacterized membrane protein
MPLGPDRRLPTGLSPAVVACSKALGCAGRGRVGGPTTPHRVATAWFGLVPVRSPLLRESRLISCCRATEMFQFTHIPPRWLWVHHRVSRHDSGRVASFGMIGLRAWMQLPLSVSSVSTSFIGLSRLGIHLVLGVACSLIMIAWNRPSLCTRERHAPRSCLCVQFLCFNSGRAQSELSSRRVGKIEVIHRFNCQGADWRIPQPLKSGKQPGICCPRLVMSPVSTWDRR